MENGGVKQFFNGDLRRHSLDEEPSAPVLLNGSNGLIIDDLGEGDEGSKSPTSKAAMEDSPADRIKRKAKRLTKGLSKEALNGGAALPVSRYLKNFRKPRNGFGRGLPKKGMYILNCKFQCRSMEQVDNNTINLQGVLGASTRGVRMDQNYLRIMQPWTTKILIMTRSPWTMEILLLKQSFRRCRMTRFK